MKPSRKLNRRSFLGQVAAVSAAGGALGLVSAEARALQITDRDPTDPVGRGRGGGSGITDSDSGTGADPAGRGRGGPPRAGATGVTDSDGGASADPAGRGRGGTGITDSDTGPYADPRGRGRGGQRGPSPNSSLPEDQRLERCRNNQERLAELDRDGATPEFWSEAQLARALNDSRALEAAILMQSRNRSGDPRVSDEAWAIVEPIALHYRYPLARQGDWYGLAGRLNYQILVARDSPRRAERLRQIQQYRTNLTALGC